MALKRLFAILITMSILVTCFTFVAVSAEEIVTLSVGGAEGKAGDIVTVEVSISNNVGFSACRLYLDYDGTKMKALGVSVGDMLTGDIMSSNIGRENEVIFVWGRIGGDVTSDGVLYTIEFELLQDIQAGEEGFRLWHEEWDFFNTQGESVPTNALIIDPDKSKVEINKIEPVLLGENVKFTGISNKPMDELYCVMIDETGDNVVAGFIEDIGNGEFSGEIITIGLDADSYIVQMHLRGQATEIDSLLYSARVEILPSGSYSVVVVTDEGGVAYVLVDGAQRNNGVFAPGETVELITAIGNGGMGPDSSASYSFLGWELSVPVDFASKESRTSFVMPESNVTAYAKYDKKGGSGVTPPNPTDPPTPTDPPVGEYPTDIAGHWAEEFIKNVFDEGIMSGYPDGTFLPENSLTRAEFATAMVNLLGLEPGGTTSFADANGHWAEPYIAVLVKAGIVTGYDETTFGVGDKVTREQIAAILDRTIDTEVELDDFIFADDADISDWAKGSVYRARAMGWMQGDDQGFRPADGAKRAEIATILSRLHTQLHTTTE